MYVLDFPTQGEIMPVYMVKDLLGLTYNEIINSFEVIDEPLPDIPDLPDDWSGL